MESSRLVKAFPIFGNLFYMCWDSIFFGFRFLGGYGLHGPKQQKEAVYIIFGTDGNNQKI